MQFTSAVPINCLQNESLKTETSDCFKSLISSVETFQVASDADANVAKSDYTFNILSSGKTLRTLTI